MSLWSFMLWHNIVYSDILCDMAMHAVTDALCDPGVIFCDHFLWLMQKQWHWHQLVWKWKHCVILNSILLFHHISVATVYVFGSNMLMHYHLIALLNWNAFASHYAKLMYGAWQNDSSGIRSSSKICLAVDFSVKI